MDNIIDLNDKKSKPRLASAGAGGGGYSTDLEKRVERLEAKFDKMDGKISSIEVTLARIEAKLDTKASKDDVAKIEAKLDSKSSKEDVAEIKGKLSQMPSTWTLIMAIVASNITIAGLILAILRFGLK